VKFLLGFWTQRGLRCKGQNGEVCNLGTGEERSGEESRGEGNTIYSVSKHLETLRRKLLTTKEESALKKIIGLSQIQKFKKN